MQPVDKFLDRLDKVQKSTKGWRACCPAHQSKGRTLSIAEGFDGKVLITCFAGCLPSEVCGALGLDEQDMFPPKPEPIYSPGKLEPEPKPFFTRKQLDELDLQVWFVAVAKSDMSAGKRPSQRDIDTLTRCLSNLKKERWRLACADHGELFLRVDLVLETFSGKGQEAA